ncbi:MAG: HAMP domain-containing sensor histidine kinase, partial [Campylobacterota bacterium]|nr:HAMP domain-containing sensor histidine kinase [Campylobacterota bacterium]
NKTQQALLFQQSKLASMGEMINNIAHQWRQPLNRINSSAAVMYTFGDKSIQQKVKDIENNTRYMSDTIEDFSNFFHPDKEKVEFDLDQALQKAMNLLNSRLNNVQLNIDNKNTMMLYGYEKEYIQVLLTILNNALDNFEINDIQNPRIAIDVKKNNHSIEVHIEDNGGGIKEEIIGKIFDPYFTTKFSSQGKGIGLYMSKMICENSMDGELNVSNGEHGAIFTIMLRVQVLK